MRTVSLAEPFAVFSDVHGNLPGLEAILADVERRGLARRSASATSSATGRSPTRSPRWCATRGIPTLMGNYDQGIGFSTGDCGCVYKTDEQRAEGAVSLAWTDEVTSDETRAYLRTLEDRFVLETPGRRAARRARQPAAHQRVPVRGPPGAGHGADGRGEPLPRHPLRPHARALRPRGRRTATRARRRCSSTSAAAAGPRTATGASATRSSTPAGWPPASRPSSSCACPTTTSACRRRSPRPI